MGASLTDLTPRTLSRLIEIADRAGVDLGVNSAKNGSHKDEGHMKGTAVDIGWINGRDIGTGPTTNPGMEALATRVQSVAAEMGNLKDRGNLGPVGKFIGSEGPLPIHDPAIRASHKNHIHLSFLWRKR